MKRAILALLGLLLAVPVLANEGRSGGGSSGLTVNSTTITSGTNALCLYDNNGVVGEQACATGSVTGTGTTGLIPDWATTSTLGDSAAYRISIVNSSSTGTTVNKLAKINTDGTAIITSAAETAGVFGIVHSGAGTSGSAVVTVLGADSCVFDNTTTAGHLVGVSSSVAGDCTDLGITGASTAPAGTAVVGTVTVSAAAGTRAMIFGTPDVQGGSQGGGNKNPGGAAGDVQYRCTGNNFCAEAAYNYDASNNRLALTGLTTATDNATNMLNITGTMPTTPTADVIGAFYSVTGAGSAAFNSYAMDVVYFGGYTGSKGTFAAQFVNANAGTGTTFSLSVPDTPSLNAGFRAVANGTGAGTNAAVVGDAVGAAAGSTAYRIGGLFRSDNDIASTAQPHIGVLGNAANSTEATNLKNVAGYFSLGTSIIASSNISAGLIVDNGAIAAPIFNAYDNGSLVFSITDGGPITTTSTFTSSRTTDLGWTPVAAANQACNTTCTSACVFGTDTVTGGILACTDATADVCLCAGAS